ncbi:MAG: GNAT family N-acetyltransferase [Calditrichota bacterium]
MNITITYYTNKNSGDFESLWVSWLTQSMGLQPQPEDLAEVQNPVENYIRNGGMVFYANNETNCVGVVAVKKLIEEDYEFCKLVVDEAARGLGLGKKLVQTCIDFVREVGGKRLYLQSFHKLEIAVQMYQKMGFTDATAPDGMLVVDRTEIIMKMDVK